MWPWILSGKLSIPITDFVPCSVPLLFAPYVTQEETQEAGTLCSLYGFGSLDLTASLSFEAYTFTHFPAGIVVILLVDCTSLDCLVLHPASLFSLLLINTTHLCITTKISVLGWCNGIYKSHTEHRQKGEESLPQATRLITPRIAALTVNHESMHPTAGTNKEHNPSYKGRRTEGERNVWNTRCIIVYARLLLRNWQRDKERLQKQKFKDSLTILGKVDGLG